MKTFLIISISFISFCSYGQSAFVSIEDYQASPVDSAVNVYEIAFLPEFKGGSNAFETFIANNIKYPEKAIKDSIRGEITVSFILSDSGRIVKPFIVKSLRNDIDIECLTVLNKMPLWRPARINGKKITYRIVITLHIKFRPNMDKYLFE